MSKFGRSISFRAIAMARLADDRRRRRPPLVQRPIGGHPCDLGLRYRGRRPRGVLFAVVGEAACSRVVKGKPWRESRDDLS